MWPWKNKKFQGDISRHKATLGVTSQIGLDQTKWKRRPASWPWQNRGGTAHKAGRSCLVLFPRCRFFPNFKEQGA